MKRQPFSYDIMNTYADRLVRHGLLCYSLGGDLSHPCLRFETSLLSSAEDLVRSSADACRSSPFWPKLKVWFRSKLFEMASIRIGYYEYPHSVRTAVLEQVMASGFDHLLERDSAKSGVRASPGSNVTYSSQWKTS
jgi:hypothetical protein